VKKLERRIEIADAQHRVKISHVSSTP